MDTVGTGLVPPVCLTTADQRHDGDARLEAAQAQGELREHQQRARDQQRKASLRGQ
ncbi:MAG TPA: hypothetical protein VMW38_18925 [Terriglobia bacterium]|nr:hypothetical protein [Terriglobia bacterium]